jgi:protein-tyrosine phosphatase
MIDFHSHIIPGVDDGSETLEQSLIALRNMWEQGITHVITTPHFSASTLNQPREFSQRIKHVDVAWSALRDAAAKELPELRLDRGAEVALDEPLKAAPDDRMRLAGTRFVLVEFPYFVAPPQGARVISQFRQLEVTPIIAHPERYKEMADRMGMLREWKVAGGYLQTNAGSLIGAYGGEVQATGWKVLEEGLADYICSD